jgi:hypothetical protein
VFASSALKPLRVNDELNRATIDTVLGEISAEKLRDVWETFPGLKLKMLQFLMIGRKTGESTACFTSTGGGASFARVQQELHG